MNNKVTEILKKLEHYGAEYQNHTGDGLVAHLQGTHNILKRWGGPEDLCLAGLCHSVYGTESYKSQTVPLSERRVLAEIIGKKAEKLAYLFGAHEKTSLWENLNKKEYFRVKDRFTGLLMDLTYEELKDLITLTLANWLEQRDRVPVEYKFIRKEEFLNSEKFLPPSAYLEFKRAYGIP